MIDNYADQQADSGASKQTLMEKSLQTLIIKSSSTRLIVLYIYLVFTVSQRDSSLAPLKHFTE